jgi:hypothetical protein
MRPLILQTEEVYQFKLPGFSAASGLIIQGDRLFCVADDELGLVSIPMTLEGPEAWIPLFPGQLPEDPIARKKAKPDIEILVELPEARTILGLPSGSTPFRDRGVLVDSNQQVNPLSFSRTYEGLRKKIPELNLEGAVVTDGRIRLFQRGNGQEGFNGIFDLPLSDFLADRPGSFQFQPVDLGLSADQSPWGFTDACLDGDSIWFLAVSEASRSTYHDGSYGGAKLGRMDLSGRVLEIHSLDVPHKPEGLALYRNSIYLVTDADDRKVSSRIYRVCFSH